MIRPRLVLCSGAQVPKGDPLRRRRKVVQLDTLNPDSNTHLRIENVTDAFSRLMPARLVDLLELATYVYTADCEASREGIWLDDDSTEQWGRDFHFVVPVRDLEFWTRRDVQESLVSTLGFLSSDSFKFTFRQLEEGRPIDDYLQMADIEDSPFYEVERVIMFSGGLDSFAGAAEAAARGDRLVLVSHRPAVKINKRQRDLFAGLRERFPAAMMHIPVWVNKRQLDRESTQRTRSFLFSALGAAVASVLRAGGVRFYENGVVGLNLPLAGEVLQSRASRMTHPEALRRLQAFYRLTTENDDFTVDNPFIYKTKAEVVSTIAEHGAADLIPQTCSCVHTMFQTRTQRHCGRCSQCIDRRFAILAAGLEEHDSGDDYESEVFTGTRKEGYDRSIAVGYARFAIEMQRMTEMEILNTHGMEINRAARCFERPAEAAQAFIDMHKRHAHAVCEVLTGQIERHSDALVDGSLDKSSLLAMIGGREHLGEPAEERAPCVGTAAQTKAVGNVFRCDGATWTVGFKGLARTVPDMKGMHYIEFLLRNRGKEFHVLRLIHEVDKKPLPVPEETYSQMSEEELAEEGLSLPGITDGEITDDEDDADLRERLKRAQGVLKSAEIRRDAAAIKQARNEIEWYRRTLSRGRDQRGQPRKLNATVESARSAVSQAIGRTLARIKKEHQALYDYLEGCLDIGATCCCRVTPHVKWTF